MLSALAATAASTLLESLPFAVAALLLARLARGREALVPYLGCGCGAGPSARSLPAACATWLLFGPLVAAARLTAAWLIDRARPHSACAHQGTALQQLRALLLPAAGGALALQIGVALLGTVRSGPGTFAAAALLAFFASPCGLGSVALAGTLRIVAPAAAGGFLCIAGLVDLRTWLPARHEEDAGHDALAYALTAIACGIAAARGGHGLVHPLIAAALVPCAAICAWLAVRHRRAASARLRIAPVLMLAGSVLSAPVPVYHATQTTLAGAFPSERIDFTGRLTRTGAAVTLVRYAITCCRADAAPIVIRLTGAPRAARGWMRASGPLIERGSMLELRAQRLVAVPPPADPYVYR